jgi:hypothetical protein
MTWNALPNSNALDVKVRAGWRGKRAGTCDRFSPSLLGALRPPSPTRPPAHPPTPPQATLTARVTSLGLAGPELQYLRAVAGPRLDARRDHLRLSSARHPDAAANKREVLERMIALVHQARALAAKFGPMPVLRTLPPYRHTA